MTRLKRGKGIEGEKDDVRFGTPAIAAEYRARRICEGADTVIEVGAGAGFQTQALARHAKKVIAIDIDGERLARAKLPPNATAIVGDALDPEIIAQARKAIEGNAVVFLDPQRPESSARRSLSEIRPDIPRFLALYKDLAQGIAIELPPFLDDVPQPCEREYLSVDHELNRLTIYTGALMRCDVSVVSLPSGERIEHSGPPPQRREGDIKARFLLEPDRALERAGLVPLALPGKTRRITVGKRDLFLAQEQGESAMSKRYEIVARGAEKELPAMLERNGCGTLILHAALAPEEQKERLHALNKSCKGERRLHAFLADGEAILARKLER